MHQGNAQVLPNGLMREGYILELEYHGDWVLTQPRVEVAHIKGWVEVPRSIPKWLLPPLGYLPMEENLSLGMMEEVGVLALVLKDLLDSFGTGKMGVTGSIQTWRRTKDKELIWRWSECKDIEKCMEFP